MFIDETFFNNSETIISQKETLKKELISVKKLLNEFEFKTLIKVLNLEAHAYTTPDLFRKYYINIDNTCSENILKLTRDIYNFNFYYNSLNFVKYFIEKSNEEVEGQKNDYTIYTDYCSLSLTYKRIRIFHFKTAYKNLLMCIIYYFSDELQSFLEKTKNIINELQSEVKNYSNKSLNVNSNEYILLRKFEVAESLNNIFSNLTQKDIDAINNFYNEFIKYFNINFHTEYEDMRFIVPVDLCHYEIIN